MFYFRLYAQPVDAKDNWWGSEREAFINGKTYDYSDDSSLVEVNFWPPILDNRTLVDGKCINIICLTSLVYTLFVSYICHFPVKNCFSLVWLVKHKHHVHCTPTLPSVLQFSSICHTAKFSTVCELCRTEKDLTFFFCRLFSNFKK